MNEDKIYEVEAEETPEIVDIKKAKKERKPLRKRIGEKLVSNEPLIPKKVKRGIAIVGGLLATGAAIAVGFIARGGGVEDLPELTDGLDPDAVPFDTDVDVADVVETIVE